jgi:DNA-binding Lrp family transcriptional regulator
MQLWPQDWDPSYKFNDKLNTDTSKPRNFAAADIGHHNMVCAVSPTGGMHANGTPEMEMRNFTKKRYNHDSKRNKVNRKLARLKNDDVVRGYEALLSHKTLKTPVYAEVVDAVKWRCTAWDVLYERYSNKQFMKLKAEARMAENKTIDELARWITWGGTKPLGWGDCSMTTGFKGTSPGGPMRKIRRHMIKTGYNVTLVKEAYTSKRAPDARGYDMKNLKKTNEDGTREHVHGVLISQGTGKTWNRDFSASINIFDIYYNSQVLGGERPWHLNKNYSTRPATDAGTWFCNW